MSRKIGKDVINELVFSDQVTGEKFSIQYRMPTTSQRQRYLNGHFQRWGGKLVNDMARTRHALGLEVLAGVTSGYFEVADGQGGWKPLITDPDAEGYEPKWKEILAEEAPDVIDRLAIYVFEGGSLLPKGFWEEIEQGGEAESPN